MPEPDTAQQYKPVARADSVMDIKTGSVKYKKLDDLACVDD